MNLKISMLFLSLALLFSSCEKEDVGTNKYTFRNDYMTSDVIIFECTSEGHKINSQSINNCEVGKTYTFTAVPQASKLKVYVTYSVFFEEKSKWVQQVYLLDKKATTSIILDGDTLLGNKEP